jgi:hypothetical protein
MKQLANPRHTRRTGFHGPPFIPDKNGNCPLPMFMRSPTSSTIASNHSLVSCGQIMRYDLGWNRGQNTVDQHCPAALQLPESVDNATSNHILVVVWSCRITQPDLVARSKLCLMGLRPKLDGQQ